MRATAYVCGLGYHELSINGRKVGDHKLDPGFTDYTKCVLYVTHDVTDMLKPGRNAIGVILGAGWYDSPATDLWGFFTAPWIAPPKLLLRIEAEYGDGTRDRDRLRRFVETRDRPDRVQQHPRRRDP